MNRLAVLVSAVLACSSPMKSHVPDGGSSDGGATGSGGALAGGGATSTGGASSAAGGSVASGGTVGTGGSVASGGAVGTGGSVSPADGSASTADLDACTSDADCLSSCIWVTAPTSPSECKASYCCGMPQMSKRRCDVNQAAWASYCPNQSPTSGVCPCVVLCPNAIFGCFGGRCTTACPESSDAGADVAIVPSGDASGNGGTGGSSTGSGGLQGGTDTGDALVLPPGSCGSDFLNQFLPNNKVLGWTIDPSNSVTTGKAAAVANTQSGVENLIDGASAGFFAEPFVPLTFAWQNYQSTTVTDAPGPDYATVSLYILQMASAEQASGLYTSLVTNPFYAGRAWSEPSSPLVGTDSRIADTGDHWWVNFYKGNCYVEVSLSPSYGPAPDYTPSDASTKAAAMTLSQAVAGKM